MDATFAYVRSTQSLVNVADPLTLSALTVAPQRFAPGQTVRIGFTSLAQRHREVHRALESRAA